MESNTMEILSNCELCPRNCHIDRTRGETGFCGAGLQPKIARIALHQWEEPPISGQRGSGAVFFSHCNLKCCFCQNYRISHEGYGNELSIPELSRKFLGLQEQGAHNLNLVTPTPYVPQIAEAIRLARSNGLTLPVIYNTSAYEKVDTLKLLDGLVDVYLPDLKYVAPEFSLGYAKASNYFAAASPAILEMVRQCGPVKMDEAGIIRSGVIVRHLIMPGAVEDSIRCIEWIKYNLPAGIYLSLMAQYIPLYQAQEHPEINRRITKEEYDRVVAKVMELDFENGFLQELEAADEAYIPEFDLTGV